MFVKFFRESWYLTLLDKVTDISRDVFSLSARKVPLLLTAREFRETMATQQEQLDQVVANINEAKTLAQKTYDEVQKLQADHQNHKPLDFAPALEASGGLVTQLQTTDDVIPDTTGEDTTDTGTGEDTIDDGTGTV
jgi:hypothetical protein